MEEFTKNRIYESMPLEELGLNNRAYNALKRAGITRIGQLMEKTVAELLDIRHFGANSLGSIVNSIGDLDLAERVELLEKQVRDLQEAITG